MLHLVSLHATTTEGLVKGAGWLEGVDFTANPPPFRKQGAVILLGWMAPTEPGTGGCASR